MTPRQISACTHPRGEEQQRAEQEASARLKAEQEESAQRLRLAQEQTNSSIRTKLILFATGGLILGAATAAVLMKLAGA